MRRGIKIFLTIILDSILVSVSLCVFALFHHVIPREMKSEEIVITSEENICNCDKENIYSCETKNTDTSYVSENISVEVETIEKQTSDGQIRYHIADIHIKDIKSFQTVFADDKYGKGYIEWLTDIDARTNSVISINGDFYGLSNKSVIIRNGKLYRSTMSNSDIAVLFSDGVLKTYTANEFNLDAVIKEGAYQAWTFGPSLLDSKGNALTKFPSSTVGPKNPRSAIGYYEPGHYVFVNVEGRVDSSIGMTLSELSELFHSLGCKSAYNFDGGQSAQMVFNNKFVNNLCESGRAISDAIIIKEVE